MVQCILKESLKFKMQMCVIKQFQFCAAALLLLNGAKYLGHVIIKKEICLKDM